MDRPISHRPLRIPGKRIILTKNMIESAIQNTKSNAAAARWIGVDYTTYKKYAKRYGVFEKGLNQSGVGIKKGYGSYRIDIADILSGSRSSPYTLARIKRRLCDEGYLIEECGICAFNEKNIVTDTICLKLDFVDGDTSNYQRDNLRLLCPSCYYSNNGTFESARNFCK
jgi:hypothetical protein